VASRTLRPSCPGTGKRWIMFAHQPRPRRGTAAAAVEAASEGAARSVSCSISELIALTRRARLFIGGDTGPMHLAAALKIPVVAIFGPTDPARNGPFGTRSIVLRSPPAEPITPGIRRRNKVCSKSASAR